MARQGHNSNKRTPGQPFIPPPASLWNSMVDAGEAHARTRLGQQQGAVSDPRETDIIKARNNTGQRRGGDVIGINGFLLTDKSNEFLWVNGVAPDQNLSFGILRYETPGGKIDKLQVAGACLAWVDVTDETHRFADIEDGSYVLHSGDSGPVEIIWKPSTGENLCLVCFRGDGGSGCKRVVVQLEATTGYDSSEECEDREEVSAEYDVRFKVVYREQGCGCRVYGEDAEGYIDVLDLQEWLEGQSAEDVNEKFAFASLMRTSCEYDSELLWILEIPNLTQERQFVQDWFISGTDIVEEKVNARVFGWCRLPDETTEGTDCIY